MPPMERRKPSRLCGFGPLRSSVVVLCGLLLDDVAVDEGDGGVTAVLLAELEEESGACGKDGGDDGGGKEVDDWLDHVSPVVGGASRTKPGGRPGA